MSASAFRAAGAPLPLGARGFTLIEVLVVLVLLGLAAALVVPRLGADERTRLRDEGERLALLLEHARVEALLSGRALAWRADERGYRFSRRDAGRQWRDIGNGESLAPRAWPPQIELAGLRVAGANSPADAAIVFPASGVRLPYDIVLRAGAWRIALSDNGAGAVGVDHPRKAEAVR